MYCSRCGKQVPDDAHYCRYCGYDFSTEESTLPCDDSIDNVTNMETDTDTATQDSTPNTVDNVAEHVDTTAIPPANLSNEANEDVNIEGTLSRRQSRRKRIKKQREIEDARSLERYTVRDDMVDEARVLPSDRLVFTGKGKLSMLKAKEIIYIVLSALVMIGVGVGIYFIKANTEPKEDAMSGLVILGYMLFFVLFFALAVGVDRVYNLLTLNELESRRITLKKYGFRMEPLTLKNGMVYSLSISGECDECNAENKGTYNIEWQGDELIAVCCYNRAHLYRIDKDDILGEDTESGESESRED